MGSLRRPSLRSAVGLAVVILAVVEVQSLVQTLRSQGRLRERVTSLSRAAVQRARPRLAEQLAPGGPGAWSAAVDEALVSGLSSEVEVFDASGGRRAAKPRPAPVEHWLSDADGEAVARGGVVSLGPVVGRGTRVLTYTGFTSGGERVVLRFASAVPELVEDLRERRQLLLGHALTLVALLLAAALALFPGGGRSEPAGPAALDVYEEAMGRLRDRGEALTRAHEARRREMEEELRDREAMARAGELTSGLAHEVRNGLATILGYARLLESGGTGQVPDAPRLIREECETLEGVLRRFVDFVRDEELSPAPFDLGRTLVRVAARESRSRPGVEVILPDPVPRAEVTGDEDLLERAFENLVRNALEAAGSGGRVELALRSAADAVEVTVADDGPGFPPGMRERGRRFFTTKAGGLGLGLPLVHKIVRLHRGELILDDRSPRGAVVTVRLPRG